MKGRWIVAAAVVFTAWPSSSNAYVVNEQESKASDPAGRHAGPSSSTVPATSVAPQASSGNTQGSSAFLLIELSKSLNAGKLKPGASVRAEIAQDVVAHGKIIIPSGTRVLGHVTEACGRSEGGHVSRLGFVFDIIRMKHAAELRFLGVIYAVAAPVQRHSLLDESSPMAPPSLQGGTMRQLGAAARPGRGGPPLPAISGQARSSILSPELSESKTWVFDASSARSGALSVGTPQSITGYKDLRLSPDTAQNTGPVVTSVVREVRLDAGTQILLRVTAADAPAQGGH